MKKTILITLILSFALHANMDWKEEVTNWRDTRVKNLTKPFGWLSLVGMEWLHKGRNSIGSGKDNDIVLSHGPEKLGDFILLADDKVQFQPDAAALEAIKLNDKAISSGTIDVNKDSDDEVSVFRVDSFEFFVIQRGKPALRIKDSQAQTRLQFKGFEYFDLDEKFRVPAKFVAYEPAKELEIINVLGLLAKEKSPGYLLFEIDGIKYQLDVLDAGDKYYLIFGDRTNGRTTYGPGRFIYVPKQQKNGEFYIDFHQSYNPPCAFTAYSTCSLPPAQNRLPIFIEAGEKLY